MDQALGSFGFAIIDTETGNAWTKTICPPGNLIGGARLSWLRTAILDELRLGVDAVGMEGYAISMPGRTRSDNMSALMELGGVIKEVCAHMGIPLRVLTSTQVKKWATGSGDGGRKTIKLANPELSDAKITSAVKDLCLCDTRGLWPGVHINNDNESDALCIAHILACADGYMEATTEAQREVLKAMGKPKKKVVRKRKPVQKEAVLL